MTAALSQSGQRTPCGQRCWRTRSKHLASSSSAERLTNSDTAMMTASSSNQDEILGPSNRMSSATATPLAITTPKPDKSLVLYDRTGRGRRRNRLGLRWWWRRNGVGAAQRGQGDGAGNAAGGRTVSGCAHRFPTVGCGGCCAGVCPGVSVCGGCAVGGGGAGGSGPTTV